MNITNKTIMHKEKLPLFNPKKKINKTFVKSVVTQLVPLSVYNENF